MDYCVVNIDFDKSIPNIDRVLKVFLSGKYIEEYSKVIEKDKIYAKEETNNIFEKYGDAFVTFVTNKDENLGLDIINALSAYKERSDLILKTLEYKSADRYKEWLVKNGYNFKKLTLEEYSEYIDTNY